MTTPRIVRRLPLSLGVLLIATAACGGSSDGTNAVRVADPTVSTSTPQREAHDVADVESVCVELQIVQDLSDEVSQSVNGILSGVADGSAPGEAETLQAFVDLGDDLEDGLPELLAAYERAAAAAPTEVAAEIRAVADGTAALTPALAEGFRAAAEAREFVDIEQVLGDPELQDAGQRAGLASLRLDSFTNPACGFQFSNS